MTPAEVHSEQFIHLVDLSHDRVLIAWGAFCFARDAPDARWQLVGDTRMAELIGRGACIGSSAESFGPATVTVLDADGAQVAGASTTERTWVWVEGLQPDTDYTYRVSVDGQQWAAGELQDSVPSPRGGYELAPGGRRYDLRFRTWPHPESDTPAVRFAAIGDFGVGTRSDSESSRRQRRIAAVLDALVCQHDVRFVIALGDSVYEGEGGHIDDGPGDRDDDWYSSFFSPYRYLIAQVPVFPAIGNHDTSVHGSDNREQMMDNFHIEQRFRDGTERASLSPGLFYRLGYGRDLALVCVDTSLDSAHEDVHRFFQAPRHAEWLETTFRGAVARWVLPFSHHPVYCAGPDHENDEEMREALVPLFDQAGVRLVFAGHEHNFQLNEVDGRTYVISGAGGKVDEQVPREFDRAGTAAWASQAHLMLVEVDGAEARLTPVAALTPEGGLHRMTALTPDNRVVDPPFVVRSE